MKQIFLLLIVFSIFTSCAEKPVVKKEPPRFITVSILPQKTFVEKIGGSDFEVKVLIPPGTSPAAYSLAPSQMAEIANSAIWFRIGYIGFEHSWKEKIAQANPAMKVVDLSESLDLIAKEKVQEGDKTNLKGVDPHVWLSPVLVKEMAQRILAELSELYPQQSAKYKANYDAFATEIDSLDAQIKNLLQPYQGKKIITFHPVLTYFARDYGLEQHSLESGGKEPTPQQMKALTDLAKNEKIGVIYIQSEMDKQQAQVFAEETGGKIIQIRPLDPDWSKNLSGLATTFSENFK